ncbi:hypothetical protein N5D77_21980 [Comamonas thiooxydans]|uniref:Uncharacterized protein n=1 Tax=Comamonas thiooxydans TaxID=363952 RepID=A0AA42Q3W7_9BURK|nr:hypothetical protein [Comamonas thiooxydans]MDH1336787.1 hypothetical protein [Comamonas thiooxydans]MDH1742949.1 hypothetical protein [Comamonas thiooxydans]MDH1789251.1 hypothetical protein [Comamonas thiooxydans]
MTAIHAYRRTAPTTVELYGQTIQFKPNDKKDVVAEVQHEKAAARLLSITEAYRLYEPAEQGGTVAQQLAASIGSTVPADAEALQKVVADQSSQIEALKRQVQELNQAAAASASVSADSGTGDGAKGGEAADKPLEQASGEGQSTSTDESPSESPYMFANEAGETIDISEWTAAQIRTFAESNEINLPKGNSVKVGELRDLLAAALRADSKE